MPTCHKSQTNHMVLWCHGVILSCNNTFSRLVQMPSKKEVMSVFIFNSKAVEVEKMSYIYCLFYKL